jgi:hypothetical protein
MGEFIMMNHLTIFLMVQHVYNPVINICFRLTSPVENWGS